MSQRLATLKGFSRLSALLTSTLTAAWIAGCGGTAEPEANKPASTGSNKAAPTASKAEEPADDSTSSASNDHTSSKPCAPVKLGGGGLSTATNSTAKPKLPPEKQLD